MSKPISIVGAGVSGLAFAQGLSKLNIPFECYERDPSLTARTQGYRFRISDEGIDALRQCLSDQHLEKLQRCCCAYTSTSSNVPLTWLDASTAEPKQSMFGSGQRLPFEAKTQSWSVDRTALRTLLMQGIEQHVRFGKALRSYREMGEDIIITFTDGSEAHGLALMGTDGAWSRVRQQLLPSCKLLDTEGRLLIGKTEITNGFLKTFSDAACKGLVMVRHPDVPCLVEAMHFDESAEEAPLDYVYWVLFMRSNSKHLADFQALPLPEKTAALVQRVTRDWYPSLRCVFERANKGQSALYRVVSARPPLTPQETPDKRVTLLGDAIHAMATTAALGATTSLRDAGLLVKLIEDHGVSNIVEVIRKYESEMRGYASEAIEKTVMGGKALFGMPPFDEMSEIDFR